MLNVITSRVIKSLLIATVCLFFYGCSSTPSLHVIGVYEGSPTNPKDDRPWWEKCTQDTLHSPQNTPKTHEQRIARCHQEHAGNHTEKEVTVRINDNTKPVVLALMAYDKTHWKIVLHQGVKIEKVLLGGYHSQRVSGIPSRTPIETYTYDPSPCEYCWQGSGYFYSYEGVPRQLKEITGLEATSYQGRYKGSESSIFPNMGDLGKPK